METVYGTFSSTKFQFTTISNSSSNVVAPTGSLTVPNVSDNITSKFLIVARIDYNLIIILSLLHACMHVLNSGNSL